MARKLTLRMDPSLIQQAKDYAIQHKRSVSQIVSDYFALLNTPTKEKMTPALPITRSLRGVLKKSAHLKKQDYQQYLEEKYL